jgi:hypothetical protein
MEGKNMQVLCKSTSFTPDLCCSVCGQGFVLSWERQSRAERAAALKEISKTLRTHHLKGSGREAHPQRGFLVSDGPAAIAPSDAATLGHAPSWAL